MVLFWNVAKKVTFFFLFHPEIHWINEILKPDDFVFLTIFNIANPKIFRIFAVSNKEVNVDAPHQSQPQTKQKELWLIYAMLR